MKVVSVRLPDEIYEKVQARSEETGIPPAVLMRSWVIAELSFRPPLHPDDQALLAAEPQRGSKKRKGKR